MRTRWRFVANEVAARCEKSGGRLKLLRCLSEEELDLIINYDIKYRMGDELESQE